MKILLANWRLNTQGGTEEWTKLMAKTLASLGHEVDMVTEPNDESYDLAIVNHLDPKLFKASRKIYTSHGVIPELEKPKSGADVYVGVSEEVRDYHHCDVVIRNPIDTERFKPTRPVNRILSDTLVISNNPIDLSELGSVTHIGGANRVPDPENFINRADLVISLGRGAYEAMACNRNVLVYDYRGGDGMITRDTYYEFRKNNCSGRYNKLPFSAIKIDYQPDLKLRDIIIKEHDPVKIAREYLCL